MDVGETKMRQCPSCGGDCGRTKRSGCQYGKTKGEKHMSTREELVKAVEDTLGVYHTALSVFHTAYSALIAAVNSRDAYDKENT